LLDPAWIEDYEKRLVRGSEEDRKVQSMQVEKETALLKISGSSKSLRERKMMFPENKVF